MSEQPTLKQQVEAFLGNAKDTTDQNLVTELTAAIQEMEQIINSNQESIHTLQAEMEELKRQFDAKKAELLELKQHNASLEPLLTQKRANLEQVSAGVNERSGQQEELIIQINGEIARLSTVIERLHQLVEVDSSYQPELDKKNAEKQELEALLEQLQAVHSNELLGILSGGNQLEAELEPAPTLAIISDPTEKLDRELVNSTPATDSLIYAIKYFSGKNRYSFNPPENNPEKYTLKYFFTEVLRTLRKSNEQYFQENEQALQLIISFLSNPDEMGYLLDVEIRSLSEGSGEASFREFYNKLAKYIEEHLHTGDKTEEILMRIAKSSQDFLSAMYSYSINRS